MKNILIVSATLNNNYELAKKLKNLINEEANVTVISLENYDLPVYTEDIFDKHIKKYQDTIEELTQHFVKNQGIIMCAPEYNGSIPPVLTNAIAWLSVQESDFRSLFNGRPIAMASVSGGGCMELLISMRIQFTHLGAQVVGRQLASNHNTPAKDESIKDILLRLLQMQPLNI